MPVEIAQLETYLEAYTAFAKENTDAPAWLRELRDSAFARFCAVGLPTSRDEDWRFTNLAPIARTHFSLPQRRTLANPSAALSALRIEGASLRLVFIDGAFSPELSATGPVPRGVTVASLRAAIAQDTLDVSHHLGRYLDIERDAFCALNTAFLGDGAFIHVPRGLALADPIHLLFISTSGASPSMTHPRNLIVVEAEAQASVVEDYVSYGHAMPSFCNSVTELIAGESATVSHTFMEREHLQSFNISTLRIQQARSANVATHSVLLGGAIVRNNVHPVLAGEGGECLINGLFLGGGRQHLDNYMLVDHAAPHCASRQFYNGILDDHAHGVFHGRIIVRKAAQQTDAKQTNRNLLLTDDAQIDTKPQLEIHADDVKCTHGATIGQLDDNALFYLQSRGLHEPEARRMLLQAFAGECIERIRPETIRAYARAAVEDRLQSLSLSSPASSPQAGESAERVWKEVE